MYLIKYRIKMYLSLCRKSFQKDDLMSLCNTDDRIEPHQESLTPSPLKHFWTIFGPILARCSELQIDLKQFVSLCSKLVCLVSMASVCIMMMTHRALYLFCSGSSTLVCDYSHASETDSDSRVFKVIPLVLD